MQAVDKLDEDAEKLTDLCSNIQTRGSKNRIRSDVTTNLVAEPAAQTTNKYFPVQFDGSHIPISSSAANHVASEELHLSQSLLFNPLCDNKSISEFVSQFDTFSPSSADVNPIVPRRDVPISRYSKTFLQFPISSSICYREFIFQVFSSATQH